MHCILIFDNLNDVLFAKYNQKFAVHLQKLGNLQSLISLKGNDASSDDTLTTDLLIQLLLLYCKYFFLSK